jgi:hypothetical protein
MSAYTPSQIAAKGDLPLSVGGGAEGLLGPQGLLAKESALQANLADPEMGFWAMQAKLYDEGLPQEMRLPRLGQQEELPFGPGWKGTEVSEFEETIARPLLEQAYAARFLDIDTEAGRKVAGITETDTSWGYRGASGDDPTYRREWIVDQEFPPGSGLILKNPADEGLSVRQQMIRNGREFYGEGWEDMFLKDFAETVTRYQKALLDKWLHQKQMRSLEELSILQRGTVSATEGVHIERRLDENLNEFLKDWREARIKQTADYKALEVELETVQVASTKLLGELSPQKQMLQHALRTTHNEIAELTTAVLHLSRVAEDMPQVKLLTYKDREGLLSFLRGWQAGDTPGEALNREQLQAIMEVAAPVGEYLRNLRAVKEELVRVVGEIPPMHTADQLEVAEMLGEELADPATLEMLSKIAQDLQNVESELRRLNADVVAAALDDETVVLARELARTWGDPVAAGMQVPSPTATAQRFLDPFTNAPLKAVVKEWDPKSTGAAGPPLQVDVVAYRPRKGWSVKGRAKMGEDDLGMGDALVMTPDGPPPAPTVGFVMEPNSLYLVSSVRRRRVVGTKDSWTRRVLAPEVRGQLQEQMTPKALKRTQDAWQKWQNFGYPAPQPLWHQGFEETQLFKGEVYRVADPSGRQESYLKREADRIFAEEAKKTDLGRQLETRDYVEGEFYGHFQDPQFITTIDDLVERYVPPRDAVGLRRNWERVGRLATVEADAWVKRVDNELQRIFGDHKWFVEDPWYGRQDPFIALDQPKGGNDPRILDWSISPEEALYWNLTDSAQGMEEGFHTQKFRRTLPEEVASRQDMIEFGGESRIAAFPGEKVTEAAVPVAFEDINFFRNALNELFAGSAVSPPDLQQIRNQAQHGLSKGSSRTGKQDPTRQVYRKLRQILTGAEHAAYPGAAPPPDALRRGAGGGMHDQTAELGILRYQIDSADQPWSHHTPELPGARDGGTSESRKWEFIASAYKESTIPDAPGMIERRQVVRDVVDRMKPTGVRPRQHFDELTEIGNRIKNGQTVDQDDLFNFNHSVNETVSAIDQTFFDFLKTVAVKNVEIQSVVDPTKAAEIKRTVREGVREVQARNEQARVAQRAHRRWSDHWYWADPDIRPEPTAVTEARRQALENIGEKVGRNQLDINMTPQAGRDLRNTQLEWAPYYALSQEDRIRIGNLFFDPEQSVQRAIAPPTVDELEDLRDIVADLKMQIDDHTAGKKSMQLRDAIFEREQLENQLRSAEQLLEERELAAEITRSRKARKKSVNRYGMYLDRPGTGISIRELAERLFEKERISAPTVPNAIEWMASLATERASWEMMGAKSSQTGRSGLFVSAEELSEVPLSQWQDLARSMGFDQLAEAPDGAVIELSAIFSDKDPTTVFPLIRDLILSADAKDQTGLIDALARLSAVRHIGRYDVSEFSHRTFRQGRPDLDVPGGLTQADADLDPMTLGGYPSSEMIPKAYGSEPTGFGGHVADPRLPSADIPLSQRKERMTAWAPGIAPWDLEFDQWFEELGELQATFLRKRVEYERLKAIGQEPQLPSWVAEEINMGHGPTGNTHSLPYDPELWRWYDLTQPKLTRFLLDDAEVDLMVNVFDPFQVSERSLYNFSDPEQARDLWTSIKDAQTQLKKAEIFLADEASMRRMQKSSRAHWRNDGFRFNDEIVSRLAPTGQVSPYTGKVMRGQGAAEFGEGFPWTSELELQRNAGVTRQSWAPMVSSPTDVLFGEFPHASPMQRDPRQVIGEMYPELEKEAHLLEKTLEKSAKKTIQGRKNTAGMGEGKTIRPKQWEKMRPGKQIRLSPQLDRRTGRRPEHYIGGPKSKEGKLTSEEIQQRLRPRLVAEELYTGKAISLLEAHEIAGALEEVTHSMIISGEHQFDEVSKEALFQSINSIMKNSEAVRAIEIQIREAERMVEVLENVRVSQAWGEDPNVVQMVTSFQAKQVKGTRLTPGARARYEPGGERALKTKGPQREFVAGAAGSPQLAEEITDLDVSLYQRRANMLKTKLRQMREQVDMTEEKIDELTGRIDEATAMVYPAEKNLVDAQATIAYWDALRGIHVNNLLSEIDDMRLSPHAFDRISAADTQKEAIQHVLNSNLAIKAFGDEYTNDVSKWMHSYQQIGHKITPGGNKGPTYVMGGVSEADFDAFENAIAASLGLIDPTELSKSLQTYLKFANWWKAQAVMSPGFIMRNLLGGTLINSLIAGVEMGTHSRIGAMTMMARDAGNGNILEGVRAIAQRGKMVHLKGLFGVNRKVSVLEWETFQELLESGVVGSGQMWSEIETAIGQGLGTYDRPYRYGFFEGAMGEGSTWKPWQADFKLFAGVRSQNERAEFILRSALGFDVMMKGGAPEDAMRAINKYHFDYQDLTKTERKIKMAIPFYTWQKNVIPVLIESIGKKPQAWTGQLRAKREMELMTQEEGVVPDYYGDLMGVRLPWKYGGKFSGGRIYATLDTPFRNLFQMTKEPNSFIREPLQSMFPWVKTPIEIFAGKQAFADIPFSGRYQQLPKTYSSIPGLMEALAPLGKAKKNSKGEWKMRDHDIYLLDQFSPIFGRARRLFANEKAKQRRMIMTWTSFIFGGGFRINDYSERRNQLIRDQVGHDKDMRDLRDIENRRV